MHIPKAKAGTTVLRFIIGAGMVLLAAGGRYGICAETGVNVPGEVRIYWENDTFHPFSRYSDKWYTQGFRLDVISSSRRRYSCSVLVSASLRGRPRDWSDQHWVVFRPEHLHA